MFATERLPRTHRLGGACIAALIIAMGCGDSDDAGDSSTSTHAAGGGGNAIDSGPKVEPDSESNIEVDSRPSIDAASDTRADHDSDSSNEMDSGSTGEADANTASTPAAASCLPGGPGMTNCGAGSESCCTSLEVAGGTYYRTYANDADGGPIGVADPATVSGFRLDKYEVTVGRFRQFVKAWNDGAGYLPPAGSGKHTHLNDGKGLASGSDATTYETGWLTADNAKLVLTHIDLASRAFCSGYPTWTDAAASQENLPMNCLYWWEAYAFCIWDGGFLPSEAEWEYAAAGGSEQREYPWGTALPGPANHTAVEGCLFPNGGTCTSVANIAQVGTETAGAGRWGQLDLAGNVFEWNLDSYAPGYANPCTDCARLTPSTDRVRRGGDFESGVSYVVPSYRVGSGPYRSSGQGLRCARTP